MPPTEGALSAVPHEDTSTPAVAGEKKPSRLVHIIELDGLRGVAAIWVFFHHVCYATVTVGSLNFIEKCLFWFSAPGDAGVDIFFVLSGFLITSLLLEDHQSKSYYQDFYWKRALRILPLYWLLLLVLGFSGNWTWKNVLVAFLFLANYAKALHVPTSGPFWSLAIEEHFYIVWPTIVRRFNPNQLKKCALGIAIGVATLRLLLALTGPHSYWNTFLRCDGLALGAYLAARFHLPGYNKKPLSDTAAISLLITSITLLTVSHLLPLSLAWLNAPFNQTGITLGALALVGFLISHRGTARVRLFRSRVLTFAGLISYAFYMTHSYVLNLYDRVSGYTRGEFTGNAYTIRFFVVLAISVGVCLISRYLIELPATRLRKYVLSKPIPQVNL